MEAPAFAVEPRADGSIRVAGELDMSRVESVERVLTPLVAADSVVVVDLSELTFCDSSAIRLLFQLYRRAVECGGELQLVGAPAAIRKVFAIAALDDLLT